MPSYILPILKELYSNQRVDNLVLKHHAFYATLKKNKEFYGKSFPQPVQHGVASGGRSARFTSARANKSRNRYKQFSLTHYTDYAIASIPRLAMEAAEKDKGSFIRELKTEFDGAYIAAREAIARDCYGDGSGKLGQVNTTAISGSSITLLTTKDALKFEIDMVLEFSATETGGAVRAGSLTVSAVNRSTGVITFTTTVAAGIPAAAASDFIYVEGDYDARFPGLDGWIPQTDPSGGDNFFGVDRTEDTERLGGFRYDGSSMSPEEALVKCLAELHDRGGSPSHVFMHTNDYTNLKIALGSKVEYDQVKAYKRADISFQGIRLVSERGAPVLCLPDVYAIKNHAKVLDMSTWELHSLKEPIRNLDFDGNKILRAHDADEGEFRIGGDRVLGCSAPGHNADCQLAS